MRSSLGFSLYSNKGKIGPITEAEPNLKDIRLGREVLRRFGERLVQKMNGYVIYFDEPTNYARKILDSLIYPEECFIPSEEERTLMEVAHGPTPVQLYRSILTEQRNSLPYSSPGEIKFRFELRKFIKCLEDSYRAECSAKCAAVLNSYKEKVRSEREEMLEKVKQQYNDRVVKRKVLNTLKLFNKRFSNIKQEIFNMLEKKRKHFELERSHNLQEYGNFLKLLSTYKIKQDADLDLMETKAKAEKIGKDTINLILKSIYAVPYQQMLKMTKKIREGIPVIESCGYNAFLDSDKWWKEIIKSELEDVSKICEEIEEDRLEIKALDSVLAENISKYEAMCKAIRILLREFHITMSVLFEEEAPHVQYLPIFEKYFKMRMSWYLANINKDLPEDALVLRKLDNRSIKAAIDETCSEEILIQKYLKKRTQPLSVTFVKMEDKAPKRASKSEEMESYNVEKVKEDKRGDSFSCYLNKVIEGMKKDPHIWSYYVGYN